MSDAPPSDLVIRGLDPGIAPYEDLCGDPRSRSEEDEPQGSPGMRATANADVPGIETLSRSRPAIDLATDLYYQVAAPNAAGGGCGAED